MLFRLILLALLGVCGTASAQTGLTLLGAGQQPAAAAGCSTYCGEGDAVASAAGWYSCATAYSAAYATGTHSGCNLRRLSDSHTCDLLLTTSGTFGNTANCSTGGENGTALATWLTATSGVVVTAYDQSGSGHNITQATSGNQPALTLAYANGMPCIHFDGTSTTLLGSFVSHAQPNSMTLTAAHLGVFGAGAAFSAYVSAGEVIDYDDSIEGPDIFAGVVLSASATISVNHAMEVVFTTSPNSAVYVDGTATTGNAGTNGTDASIALGANAGGGNFENMEVCSAGIWTGVAFNGTQAAALRTVQKAAYSTP